MDFELSYVSFIKILFRKIATHLMGNLLSTSLFCFKNKAPSFPYYMDHIWYVRFLLNSNSIRLFYYIDYIVLCDMHRLKAILLRRTSYLCCHESVFGIRLHLVDIFTTSRYDIIKWSSSTFWTSSLFRLPKFILHLESCIFTKNVNKNVNNQLWLS